MGGGKLGSRVAASAPAQSGGSGRLVLLVDEATGDKFLVDTGAVFSVLPFSSDEPPTGPRINTADASPIPCWGWVERRLRAGGICFSWRFLRAKVAFPILGADFLESFDLVDSGRGSSPLSPFEEERRSHSAGFSSWWQLF